MNLLSDEEQAEFEIENLIVRLNKGMPADWRAPEPESTCDRNVRFILDMGVEIANQVVLIIRTGRDDITRGIIALPSHFDLPETEEGPYRVREAVRLAKLYAVHFTDRVIVDIESSQLWDPKWGDLEIPPLLIQNGNTDHQGSHHRS